MRKQIYKMNNKLVSIFRTVLRVNMETKADCFLYLSPHVESLSVFIHKDGWTESNNYTDKDMYTVNYNDYTELEKIEILLNKILDGELERIEEEDRNAY